MVDIGVFIVYYSIYHTFTLLTVNTVIHLAFFRSKMKRGVFFVWGVDWALAFGDGPSYQFLHVDFLFVADALTVFAVQAIY
jgi:hypothetical protein